jgi:HupE/UreJ protein
VATALAIVLQPGSLRAHDMPSDVLVQMFVRPAGTHLQVIVRLPLISLLNINLPKRGEDFLDLSAIEPALKDAARATADAVDFFEDGNKLAAPAIGAVGVSLPSDTSFASYESALAHVRGPALPVETEIVWNQGFFDTLLEYKIASDSHRFAVQPYFTSLAPRVVSAVHVVSPNGVLRSFTLNNDPGLVHLNPGWHQAAWTFVRAGFLQIPGGAEYLLILLCLAIPVRRLKSLWPSALAFVAASSTTLIASAFQIAPVGAWFPPAIQALVAVAIVCMALDNVFLADQRHRWTLAFGFGFPFGFALSFALRQTLQFAGDYVLTSVVSFTLGVGVAELLALTILVPALTFLFRLAVSERVGVIVVSGLACHTAWHWMVARITFLTTINWPLSDLLEVTRWGTAVAFMAAVAVLLMGFARSTWGRARRVRLMRLTESAGRGSIS